MSHRNNCGCGGGSHLQKPQCTNIKFEDVEYLNSPELSCLDPNNEIKDLLDFALKVEAKICEAMGDYSLYDVHCIEEEYGYILTEQQFVEAITDKVCEQGVDIIQLQEDFNNFDVDALWEAIDGINMPELTLINLGVGTGDSLVQILQKINSIIGDLQEFTNIENVDWSTIVSIGGSVTDLNSAFTAIINKINSMGGGSVVLPTFNTTNTCLPDPSASDTLSSVVTKLVTEVCNRVKVDLQAIDTGCVTINGVEFQNYLQTIFDTLTLILQNRYEFDDDVFEVESIGGQCDGYKVTIKDSILQNMGGNLVSSQTGGEPGFLSEVLSEGDNVTLELEGDQLKVNASFENDKVKASSIADTSKYLVEVIEGIDGIVAQLNSAGDKIILSLDSSVTPEEGRVLSSTTDDTLGYLINKIEGATGIDVTLSSDGRKVIISNTQESADGKVKVDAQGAYQYLYETLISTNSELTIEKDNDKVKFTANNDKVKVNSVGQPKYLIEQLDTKDTLTSLGLRVNRFIEGGKIFHNLDTNYTKIGSNVLDAISNDSTLQQNFCTMVSDCGGGGTGEPYTAKTIYVDSSNTSTGNGSPMNPFKSLQTAVSHIIGSGSRAEPEVGAKEIVVRAGEYSILQNLLIKGVTYKFNNGVFLIASPGVGGTNIFDTQPLGNIDIGRVNILGHPRISVNHNVNAVVNIGHHPNIQGVTVELGGVSGNVRKVFHSDSKNTGENTGIVYISLRGKIDKGIVSEPIKISAISEMDITIDGHGVAEIEGTIYFQQIEPIIANPEKYSPEVRGVKFTGTANSCIEIDNFSVITNIVNNTESGEYNNFVEFVNTANSNVKLVGNKLKSITNIIQCDYGQYISSGNIVPTGAGFTNAENIYGFEVK